MELLTYYILEHNASEYFNTQYSFRNTLHHIYFFQFQLALRIIDIRSFEILDIGNLGTAAEQLQPSWIHAEL